ncbi:MAG: hypothetical protein HFE86_03510 [Clostridiales bacterium]|nr:hypothetical protein [Clostridiales bacterium]
MVDASSYETTSAQASQADPAEEAAGKAAMETAAAAAQEEAAPSAAQLKTNPAADQPPAGSDPPRVFYQDAEDTAAFITCGGPEAVAPVFPIGEGTFSFALYKTGEKAYRYDFSLTLEKENADGSWQTVPFDSPGHCAGRTPLILPPPGGAETIVWELDFFAPECITPGLYRIGIPIGTSTISKQIRLYDDALQNQMIQDALAHQDKVEEHPDGVVAVIPEQRVYAPGVSNIKVSFVNTTDQSRWCSSSNGYQPILYKLQNGEW